MITLNNFIKEANRVLADNNIAIDIVCWDSRGKKELTKIPSV